MNCFKKLKEKIILIKGLYILAFIILLQVVFIFWAVYKGFIENEL